MLISDCPYQQFLSIKVQFGPTLPIHCKSKILPNFVNFAFEHSRHVDHLAAIWQKASFDKEWLLQLWVPKLCWSLWNFQRRTRFQILWSNILAFIYTTSVLASSNFTIKDQDGKSVEGSSALSALLANEGRNILFFILRIDFTKKCPQ